MSFLLATDYISAGGNRHSAAADWSRASNLVAFGSDQNVALWYPLDKDQRGISALLRGHTHSVKAVKFLKSPNDIEYLITGSAGGEIKVWTEADTTKFWSCQATITAHDGAINAIAVSSPSRVFATGGSDTKIRLWKVENGQPTQICEITPKSRFIPLALSLGSFPTEDSVDGLFLAAAGTRNDIQVFSVESLTSVPTVKFCANLTGHEGWVRSLALLETSSGDLLLSSASQDKYVRIWRFRREFVKSSQSQADSKDNSKLETELTAKVHKVSIPGFTYLIRFEALLLGHEDWIYSANWKSTETSMQLLTASADGSLAIWEPDPTSGIWVTTSRLGEISALKGATTATGSSGGFWIGLWSPDGQAVICLGRTGSWRIWQYAEDLAYWIQRTGISGHVDSVNSMTWQSDGGYLLSTSSDQTTRLHTEWKRDSKCTWHEFSRPQIHGYDLNCITSTSSHQFCSGADEKLLRVFDAPKVIGKMLQELCMVEPPTNTLMPDAAAMPVLGLSNKPLDNLENTENENSSNKSHTNKFDLGSGSAVTQINEPPSEDLLARHTLWPEREKLYGHGHEISEAAISHDGMILATACKASSIDHAAIRLYNTSNWHEIKPSLSAHSLTVTRLAWSDSPEQLLLSVGRDRQWSLFKRSENKSSTWRLLQSNPKAHSRMILDAAWLPLSNRLSFATAGRDKTIKIWRTEETKDESPFSIADTIVRKAAVTSIAFTNILKVGLVCLAVGEDNGTLSLHIINIQKNPALIKTTELDVNSCPSNSVTRLAWRPQINIPSNASHGYQLAVAVADGSVRILRFDLDSLCDEI